MQVHPRIQQRIHQNRIAKEAEIQSRRCTALDKLDGILVYLRGTEIYSKTVDVDDLIAEIEDVRSKFASFKFGAENPSPISDAIAPHIGRILYKLQQLELEQEVEPVA